MLYRVSVTRGRRTEYVAEAKFDEQGRPISVSMVGCIGGGQGYDADKAEALRRHLSSRGEEVSTFPV